MRQRRTNTHSLTAAASVDSAPEHVHGSIEAPGLAAPCLHIKWLPSHGINGWTGGPKAKCYELLGVRPEGPGWSANERSGRVGAVRTGSESTVGGS